MLCCFVLFVLRCCDCCNDGQAVQVVPRWRHHLPLLSMVRHGPLIDQPSPIDPLPPSAHSSPASPSLSLSLFTLVLCCCSSRSHLALHDELVSKAFQGRHGRAFLFGNVSDPTPHAKQTTHCQPTPPPLTDQHASSPRCAVCPAPSINVTLGPSENRILMTGLHTVCDIYCLVCCDAIGWYYMEAFEESEKYKEKKYIVEKAKITKETLT